MGRQVSASRRTTRRLRQAHREVLVARQVFETWWIGVPWGFDERWIAEGGYWHAWDRRRSVSVSSTVITGEGGRPVTAAEMVDRFAGVVQGEPIAEAPDG